MIDVLIALALSSGPATQTTDADSRRAAWERGQAEDRAFRRKLFADAGFEPVLPPDRPERRQLLLRDPYSMLPMPGVEVARSGAGAVTLTVRHAGWSEAPVTLPAATWQSLTALDTATFVPARYVPVAPREGPPPPPPPICHGWTAYLAADEKAPASWGECGGAQAGAARDYATRMIALAMRTRPDCAFDERNPFWSFQRCFAADRSFNDADLGARFDALQQEVAASDLGDPLSRARTALSAPAMTLGSPAWIAARDAVNVYRAGLGRRRDALRRLRVLAYGARDASPADRERLRRTIESWQGFSDGQESNTVDLLARLAAAPA